MVLVWVPFYSQPVLVSLQEFSGFFSLLEKSGWFPSPRVALSLGVLGSSAVIVASDPVLLARIWPLAIIYSGVERLRCTSC